MGDKTQQGKPFMTYEQQIYKLRNDKKLEIRNVEYAIHLLKEHSYFALISGYKAPFKSEAGTYKIHTSIEEIYNLYVFDDDLRTLFFKYILKIEKHIKSLISYSFCEAYGEEQQHYLNATKYNYETKQNNVNEMISRFTNIINDHKNYPYIKHQQSVYGNIPLWVMMKALTLGSVSKMYSFLPQSIQHNISKEFDYVHESMLIRMLDILARVRNVCAHNERLYDYKYNKGTIDDTYVHRALKISRKYNQFTKGKNDLFSIVIVLKYLLASDDFTEFVNKLDMIIKKMLEDAKVLQISQLYKYMGFPLNWKEITIVCSK